MYELESIDLMGARNKYETALALEKRADEEHRDRCRERELALARLNLTRLLLLRAIDPTVTSGDIWDLGDSLRHAEKLTQEDESKEAA